MLALEIPEITTEDGFSKFVPLSPGKQALIDEITHTLHNLSNIRDQIDSKEERFLNKIQLREKHQVTLRRGMSLRKITEAMLEQK